MISTEELKKIKEIRKTNLYYAEKEYLQYIFLNSMSRYADNFVFKGGTCLRIAFELERASEDLDFNTNLSIKETKKIIRNCLKDFDLLNIAYEIYAEKTFEGNYRAEIRFRGPLYMGGNRTTNTIKIDFNKRKNVYKEARLIKKLFSDVPPFTMVVMEKRELLAEKLRALCMRAEPRDLYDVWVIISLGESIDRKLLYKKLKEDNIKYFKLNLPSKKSYENDLKLLLKNVPEYKNVVKYVEMSLKSINVRNFPPV